MGNNIRGISKLLEISVQQVQIEKHPAVHDFEIRHRQFSCCNLQLCFTVCHLAFESYFLYLI